MDKKIYRLKGRVQHYEWGGYDFIPELLQIEKQRKHYAEYWLGAHPSAPSELQSGDVILTLDQLIHNNPAEIIGEKVLAQFGELPYLFKILDVHDMLSIQVHPTKAEAEKGFAAEEAAGVPINASHRNYKDRNHKPEVMIALSEFWLLHGFRQKTELNSLLASVQEFNFLRPVFESAGYKGLYKKVMALSASEVDDVLTPLVLRETQNTDDNKNQPGFWVRKLYQGKSIITNIDKGVFSVYFFNLVNLKRGEGIFQGAGIPHAYLEGQNVELMANSDNVLRGGLTPKHIDVNELMKHTRFEGVTPQILTGTQNGPGEKNYSCPVADFAISALDLDQDNGYAHTSYSPEIYIVIEGDAVIDVTGERFSRGESFLVVSGTTFEIRAPASALLYKAFVPQ